MAFSLQYICNVAGHPETFISRYQTEDVGKDIFYAQIGAYLLSSYF